MLPPSSFTVCLTCVLTALADTAAAQQAPVADDDKTTMLDTVVVTGNRNGDGYQAAGAKSATKTDTPLLDTPQAIVVVPRAVLEDQNARDLHDAARNVSGVSRQTSYWGQNTGTFRVRGFDLDESAGYLRDGFRYFARGTVLMSNVQSVEILKGPASVLYGRIEPGGLANIVSATPSRDPAHSLEVRAARFDQYSAAAGSTGPLDAARAWRYRLDAELEDSKSFRDLVYNKRVAVSPQLAWQPDAATRIRAYAEYQQQDTVSDYGIPAWQGRPAEVPHHWFYGEPFNQQESRQWRALLSAERKLSDTWTLRAGLSSSLFRYAGDYDEAYSSFVGDFGPDGTGPSDGVPRVYRYWGRFPELHGRHYLQAEVLGRADLFGVPHKLLLGAELGRQVSKSNNGAYSSYPSLEIFNPVLTGVFVPQPDRVDYRSRNDDRIQAAYVQDEIALAERWRLLLGARYDRYVQDYLYVATDGFDQRASTRDESVSPRAGVLFKLTSALSLYASASRSFAPAAAYFSADQGRGFKPLVGEQGEVGAKWDSDDGRFTASVALYDLRKRNVVTQDPENPRFSIQIGEERSTGFEVDLAAQPWSGVHLIASFARMNARISQSTDFPVGNRLPFAPRSSGSLWASWRLPEQLAGMAGWQIGAGAFAQGRRAGDLENTVFLPPYVRWDASLGWRSRRWQAQLAVENLTNRRYFESGTGSGAGVIYPGAPRTTSLSVRRLW